MSTSTVTTPTLPPGWGPHHLRFNNLDSRVLDITDRYFRSNPWTGDVAAKATRWVDRSAQVYGIDSPTVRFVDPTQAYGAGCYRPAANDILLPKASATTLFHEFRHAVQAFKPEVMVPARFGGDPLEEDARAWSLSLFFQVRPERFATMVRAGRIWFVPTSVL